MTETTDKPPAPKKKTTTKKTAAKKNLHQKILAIASEVGTITRDKKATTDGRTYSYVGHDLLSSILQPLLVKYGVVVLPVVEDVTYQTYPGQAEPLIHTIVEMRVTLVDADKPDDNLTIKWQSNALWKGDKGLAVAISSGTRQCLMKAFCIPSGEPDIETADTRLPGKVKPQPAQRPVARVKKDSKDGPKGETVRLLGLLGVPPQDYQKAILNAAGVLGIDPPGEGGWSTFEWQKIFEHFEDAFGQMELKPKE